MLSNLSWTLYFEVVILLLAIYYLFVIIKYYGEDLRHILKFDKKGDADKTDLPIVLQYQGPEMNTSNSQINSSDDPDYRQDNSLTEADALIGQLKKCIQSASGKPFAPAILIPQIKEIFNNHIMLRDSPHRPAINELVVSECERLGTALLTEDEVDKWWSE